MKWIAKSNWVIQGTKRAHMPEYHATAKSSTKTDQ